jgi:hypothetical protein
MARPSAVENGALLANTIGLNTRCILFKTPRAACNFPTNSVALTFAPFGGEIGTEPRCHYLSRLI